MYQERFLLLLSRKFAGECTTRELNELEQLMQQQPDLRLLASQFPQHAHLHNSDDEDEAEAAFAAHAVKMQLSGRMDPASPHRMVPEDVPIRVSGWNRKLGALLACSLVMLAVAVVYIDKKDIQPKPVNAEVVTRKGATSTLQLPDGTKVWLNADSKLVYPQAFTGDKREVTLSGEAYFDVSHDNLHPFIIHTDKINIQVLGTAFNVKSYPQEEVVETALIRGKIAVTFNGEPEDKVILQPNEKLTYRKTASTAIPRVQVSTIQAPDGSSVPETAWIRHKMIFSNTPMLQIAQTLERRFNVEFVFDSVAVKSYTYTGSYEDESLEEILDVLQLCRPFHYEKTGSVIRVRS